MRLTVYLCLMCLTATMPAAAHDLDAKFLIKREGKVIGYHHVDVHETAFGTVVFTEIEMRVRLGPVPLFKYDHDSREVWREGEIITIDSDTNNNGEKTYLRAQREDGVLQIDGSGYQGPAPAEAMPSSYWDKSMIAANTIISTLTGEIIDVSVEHVGETLAPHFVKAEQYRVTGTVTLDIWYDGQQMVGSQIIIDGEELTYVLVSNDRQYAALADFMD
ncbi:MAG: hypothetical protein GXP04_10650 [Alphaproteobacteria bacterium]|nr:hypothetical protein [Marinicaulis sp.]NOX95522.1 hypothetical protein [Alphaproteobacteria bacterium]